MLSIDSSNVWFELKYDEEISVEQFLEGVESFYVFVKQNPKQVTQLLNKYGCPFGEGERKAIILSELGF